MITNQSDKKVFFITGGSKGFGLILTNKLLKQGFNVVSTSRSKEQLTKSVDQSLVTEYNFLPLELDITSDSAVKVAVQEVIKKFNRIDVVINNAGYSMMGTIEELTDKEVKDMFDVNFYGVLNVVRNTLPHLRVNKVFADGPRIINISSIAGYVGGFPGFSLYCSSKFALDGFTEGLAEDVKEFGIHVTTVKPGYFRTEFLTSTSVQTPSHPIQEYTAVRKIIDIRLNQVNGNQPGDPEKGCDVIINCALQPNPPLHLFLGSDAVTYAKAKIEKMEKAIKDNYDVSVSTDFEKK